MLCNISSQLCWVLSQEIDQENYRKLKICSTLFPLGPIPVLTFIRVERKRFNSTGVTADPFFFISPMGGKYHKNEFKEHWYLMKKIDPFQHFRMKVFQTYGKAEKLLR